MSAIKRANIEFSCPSCGASGYEEELDADEIAKATEVSFPCDECGVTIVVYCDVSVHVSTRKP
jgi:predicted RNA-binding Zn-ribbon protein involved in translation (DUF1610 family)